MVIKTVKTRVVRPPKDDIRAVIGAAIRSLPEKSVVVVTSKIVSIGEGRCVPTNVAGKTQEKDALVIREAEWYLPRRFVPGAWCMHTLKNNVFIPSAGIDESNADGYYILWPRDPHASAKEIWSFLRKKYKVKDLGVIVSDSHTIPLRRGVLGISLGHFGFAPLKDYRGKPDLFGRRLKMTQTNIADGLAAAAVTMMGEGSERTPIAIVSDIPWVRFEAKPSRSRKPFSSFEIKTREDLYYPLLSSVPWRKGKGKKKN